MSVVSLLGVNVLNNPAKFGDAYQFEITFECLEALREDVEWKLTYVGSAQSNEHDQELDSLLVGPIPVGVNKFVFEAAAPDVKRIPDTDILGVTVILLTGSYDDREFVRVGYYVNNEYDSDELNADPPAKPLLDRVRRNILAEKPRVTRFAIKWDSDASAPPEFPPEQPDADVEADGDQYGAEEEEDEDDEEEAETEAAEVDPNAMVDDSEKAKAAGVEEEETGDESEDLEGESSGSEGEDVEGEEDEEAEEVDGDDAMEVDGTPQKATGTHEASSVAAH